jgi:hypothetical protein
VRWLRAPEVYRRLVYPLIASSDETIAFVANSLRAERCLLGRESALVEPAWTALGDVYFPAAPTRHGTAKSQHAGVGWRPELPYSAPTLANGPAVDGVSPSCTIDGGDRLMPLVMHSPAEFFQVVARIHDAMAQVGDVSPEVVAAIGLGTQVIVCKKTRRRDAGFSSLSWSAFIGKTALVNSHSPELTSARIANALIHEAIHALLFMLDEIESIGIESLEAGNTTIVSPWSKRDLSPGAYIHACFVWYGLWCFWQLAAASTAFAPAEVAAHAARAAFGFRARSLLAPLAPFRKHLSSEILDSMEEAQETVAARFASHRPPGGVARRGMQRKPSARRSSTNGGRA